MAFVTGEVVEDTGGETPFKVVFKQGDTVLAEWGVDSKEDGEEEIVAAIRGLSEEGDEDDEEDEDGNDEGEGDDDKPRSVRRS
jgi:hypothetical protein